MNKHICILKMVVGLYAAVSTDEWQCPSFVHNLLGDDIFHFRPIIVEIIYRSFCVFHYGKF